MRRIQLRKIKKCISHAYNNTKFYHDLFKKNNLRPSQIKSFSDLTKIPYTKTESLQANPNSFFAVPEEKFAKVFTTSGTTGRPKKAYFTKSDIDKIIASAAIGGRVMYGITSKDVIRITFAEGYGTEIWGNRYCIDRAYGGILGALTLSSERIPVEYELEIIKQYKPNIYCDVTSRINYLTNELQKLTDLKSLGVKKIMIGAEPTPNSLRKKLEEAWDADVYIGYGTTEIGLLMAGECEQKYGMHLSELNFYTEVVDPKTKEQLEDGETGELIYTTFDREGMPLIRYNSKDLGRIIPGICECGLPLRRIEIKGRTDDLIPIGSGDNLFTKMFDDIIFSFKEIIEYQVVFDKKNGMDLVTIVAETSKPSESLKNKIIQAIFNMPEIKNGIEKSKTVTMPEVKFIKPNTFKRDKIKHNRLIDKRDLYS